MRKTITEHIEKEIYYCDLCMKEIYDGPLDAMNVQDYQFHRECAGKALIEKMESMKVKKEIISKSL
ncbi:MAG: hypothetical protein AAB588_05785 [Patescibacteria group bacterium]